MIIKLAIRFTLCALLSLLFLQVKAQVVYQTVQNKGIYDFLDELANEQIITINAAIKPYSRQYIASRLKTAEFYSDNLNPRQKKELLFYLRDYNKEILNTRKFDNKRFDVFYYKDSLFTLSVNPIFGAWGASNKNDINYTKYNGAQAFAYVGKNVGIYASLVDYYEKIRLADTGIMTKNPGGVYKGTDHSEMRGGITVSWNWGNISLIKDYNEWGNYYSSPNIFSTKPPSFGQIKLRMNPVKWFEFNYIHGWLISDVIDSNRTYNYNGVQRNVFHDKCIAANFFTFIPVEGLNLSIGNSIVYSDKFVHIPYLIPFMFYKSIDHTYNSATNFAGQNSQLFFDISCRLIPKTHIFYSMYLDDLGMSRMFDKNQHSNHWSMKWGSRISNLIFNTSFTFEYTRTNPLTYKNDNITTLFNSNWYTLGHYLIDNSDELYLAIDWKPHPKFIFKLCYQQMRKGPDFKYERIPDPLTVIKVWGRPFMSTVEWKMSILGFHANYQILNDVFLYSSLEIRNQTGNQERYSSLFYQGNTTTFSAGFNYDF